MIRLPLLAALLVAASASAQQAPRPDGLPSPVLIVPPAGEGRALPDPTVRPAARARSASGVTPATAVLLSLGATAGGVGLGALVADGDGGAAAVLAGVAVVVGPSVGNLALGARRDALVGAGLRAVGAGLAVGSVAATFDNDRLSGAERDVLAGLAVVGAAAFVGGLGYDLVTSTRNAGRVSVAPGLDGETRRPVGVLRVGL